MATPHNNASYSNDETVNTNEKLAQPNDSDSSSGHVVTIEDGVVPSANLMVVDRATERAVLRKLDYRIVPMIMWVYLMNMMDRGEFSVL
jgi:hypothetical protein